MAERHEVEVPTSDPWRNEPGRELMGHFVEFGNTDAAAAAVVAGACDVRARAMRA